MSEIFREWLRQNRNNEQLRLCQSHHHYNLLVLEDFIDFFEEEVMEWVAEQCRMVLEEDSQMQIST